MYLNGGFCVSFSLNVACSMLYPAHVIGTRSELTQYPSRVAVKFTDNLTTLRLLKLLQYGTRSNSKLQTHSSDMNLM